jgi:lipid A disaccharide synthetase
MQEELNGERLAAELLLLLEQQRNLTLRRHLHEVAHQLGEGGASRRAAEHILDFLKRGRKDSQD